MFVFICPVCGRFGSIPTPDKAINAACSYCGNKDIDWVSRPDLDNPKDGISFNDETAVAAYLRAVERLALDVLGRAYDAYDSTSDSPATKLAALQEIEGKLYDLFDRFTKT